MVYRLLLTTGILKSILMKMIQNKKDLANLTVGSGESWVMELSTDQLRDLVRQFMIIFMFCSFASTF
jgi:hypothetical protein